MLLAAVMRQVNPHTVISSFPEASFSTDSSATSPQALDHTHASNAYLLLCPSFCSHCLSSVSLGSFFFCLQVSTYRLKTPSWVMDGWVSWFPWSRGAPAGFPYPFPSLPSSFPSSSAIISDFLKDKNPKGFLISLRIYLLVIGAINSRYTLAIF